ALAHALSVEAHDPGEEVDLLDALGHRSVYLRHLSADVIDCAFSQLPWVSKRALQGLRDIARADEISVHRDCTREFADRLVPVVYGPSGEGLSTREQSTRSAHAQYSLNLFGSEF